MFNPAWRLDWAQLIITKSGACVEFLYYGPKADGKGMSSRRKTGYVSLSSDWSATFFPILEGVEAQAPGADWHNGLWYAVHRLWRLSEKDR